MPCPAIPFTSTISPLASRVRGEFVEMPGLQLTVPQAATLFGLTPEAARSVLDELRQASVLRRTDRGSYSLKR